MRIFSLPVELQKLWQSDDGGTAAAAAVVMVVEDGGALLSQWQLWLEIEEGRGM